MKIYDHEQLWKFLHNNSVNETKNFFRFFKALLS